MKNFDTEVRTAYLALTQQEKDAILAMMQSWAKRSATPSSTEVPKKNFNLGGAFQ